MTFLRFTVTSGGRSDTLRVPRNRRGQGPPGVANRFVPWVTQVPVGTGPTRRPAGGLLGPPFSHRGAGARSAGRAADRDTGGRGGRAARAAPRAARRRSSAT